MPQPDHVTALQPADEAALPEDLQPYFQKCRDKLGFVPNVLVVNARKVQARSVQELIALARSRPRDLSYGSGGNGSAAHIAMVAFNLATRTEMEHIPYRGTAPMMNDLISGAIDLTLTGGPPALPAVRNGLLRALGVSSLQRLAAAPDISVRFANSAISSPFFISPSGVKRAGRLAQKNCSM